MLNLIGLQVITKIQQLFIFQCSNGVYDENKNYIFRDDFLYHHVYFNLRFNQSIQTTGNT